MRNFALACLLILPWTGCATQSPQEVEGNRHCPILPEQSVDGVTFVEWNGVKIGLCCSECVETWDRMTESMKREALARVNR